MCVESKVTTAALSRQLDERLKHRVHKRRGPGGSKRAQNIRLAIAHRWPHHQIRYT